MVLSYRVRLPFWSANAVVGYNEVVFIVASCTSRYRASVKMGFVGDVGYVVGRVLIPSRSPLQAWVRSSPNTPGRVDVFSWSKDLLECELPTA